MSNIYSDNTIRWDACATKTDLMCGSATAWYRHENADACRKDDSLRGPVLGRKRIQKWYGYYSQVGWHNPMAEFRSNDFEGRIVDGPFPTREEAIENAVAYLRAQGVNYDMIRECIY